MKILLVYESDTENLILFSQTIASSLPMTDSMQVMSARDVTSREWLWADWLILGVSWVLTDRCNALRQLSNLPGTDEKKWLAIFQLQSRLDPPISAAYGYALGRNLRDLGLTWVAPPAVFFGRDRSGSEFEGELIRAGQWLGEIASVVNGAIPRDC